MLIGARSAARVDLGVCGVKVVRGGPKIVNMAGKKIRTTLKFAKSAIMDMGMGGENRKKIGIGRELLK